MPTTISPITGTITAVPALRHRNTVNPTIQADKDDFVNKYEANNDAIAGVLIGEINTKIGQINTTTSTINTVGEELNTIASEAASSASDASTSATNAASSALAASTSATNAASSALAASTSASEAQAIIDNITVAPLWVSGTDYTAYTVRTDPVDFKTYKAKVSLVDSIVAPRLDSSNWQDISTGGAVSITSVEFLATAGQTVFTTPYSVGMIDVFRNGMRLSESDYTATNGTSITLSTSAAVDDIISVKSYSKFDVANTYTKVEIDNKDSLIIKPTITTPTTGTVDYIGSITSSAYALASTYKGTLDYVEWQLATDVNFTNIVHSKNDSLSLSYTPQNTSPTTEYFVRVRYGSDNHLSNWSDAISFTTPAAVIYVPTITTPTNGAIDLGKNVAITSSAYTVFGHSEPHASSDWQIATDVNFTNIVHESLNNTTNKISWTTPNLTVSTTYYARVRYKSASYVSAYGPAISFTTKALFTPLIGTQGDKGFGVAPTDQPFALLGLAEMTGTNTVGHDNYGNYIHTNGSIVCWCPKAYYRVGNASSPRYATYGANALDIVGTDVFETEAQANASGYVLHRAFINAGAEKAGFFIDKYMNSKDGTTSSKSVFGGVPISLATTAGYTVSNGMTGCTGILADAVVLSKARGVRWNTALAFQYAWLAMVSVAQGQAATSTANCAWYDATLTTNFPKGCNNNALSDVNDSSVVYATAGDSGNANKPKTGATANFAKTTHNGSNNGVADLNGGMFEVSIGITSVGTTATSTTAIATDAIYTLKTTIDHASLTGGWNGTNDVWGDATNLATKYNAVTSPHPLGSATGTVYWGNGANAIFPTDTTGVNRDICGFIPKNSSASNATGINMMGNDYSNKYNIHNMVPQCCGAWGNAANAGLFSRNFNSCRSNDAYYVSFRASAYFA